MRVMLKLLWSSPLVTSLLARVSTVGVTPTLTIVTATACHQLVFNDFNEITTLSGVCNGKPKTGFSTVSGVPHSVQVIFEIRVFELGLTHDRASHT